MQFWPVVLLAGIIAIVFAAWLARDVLSGDKGTKAMQEVAGLIFEGAMAFLNRQYRTIAMLAIVAAVIIGVLIGILANNPEHGLKTAIAFLVGAFCSGLAGFIGMYIAVQANLRTPPAAQRILDGVATVPFEIVGFGFGASFVALFAQLGGGIYTKAADVGADLVGKVEAGIPEDDPRNPAVIADLVGDNVGDCAGRGADLFESTAAENIGAMILGVALYVATGNTSWVFFPLVVRSVGIIASIVGIFAVRPGGVRNPQRALNMGYYVTAALSVAGMFVATQFMLGNLWFFWCGVVGILLSVAFVYITQYYTSGSWRPVQEIANASRTGPATNIIAGIAIGFENTALPALAISLALYASYHLG